ncbi:hypothetical protein ACGFX4_37785 [Kitasatospora sp. NPDC048365]|uniref:hypothetical protein n=1 Tax=Kitasatospora sp. NPDC048365 TaxID=3364050 RepID=UPI00371D8701
MPSAKHLWHRRNALAIVLIVLAGIALATFFLDSDEKNQVKVDDVSGRGLACLITDPAEATTSSAGDLTWQVMREEAPGQKANVQRLDLPLEGPASPHVASLLNRRCDLIISTGSRANSAVRESAERNPTKRFAAVDPSGAGFPSNVSAISGDADAIRRGVRDQIKLLHANG